MRYLLQKIALGIVDGDCVILRPQTEQVLGCEGDRVNRGRGARDSRESINNKKQSLKSTNLFTPGTARDFLCMLSKKWRFALA